MQKIINIRSSLHIWFDLFHLMEIPVNNGLLNLLGNSSLLLRSLYPVWSYDPYLPHAVAFRRYKWLRCWWSPKQYKVFWWLFWDKSYSQALLGGTDLIKPRVFLWLIWSSTRGKTLHHCIYVSGSVQHSFVAMLEWSVSMIS